MGGRCGGAGVPPNSLATGGRAPEGRVTFAGPRATAATTGQSFPGHSDPHSQEPMGGGANCGGGQREDWLGNSHSPGSHQHQPLLREEHPESPFELNLMLDHMFVWVLLVFVFPFF